MHGERVKDLLGNGKGVSKVEKHPLGKGIEVSRSPYYALRSQSLPCASKGAILRSAPFCRAVEDHP